MSHEIELPLDDTWVTIPTPQGPDIEVRYNCHERGGVVIEWRVASDTESFDRSV